jgi:hypothetical protein
MVAAASASSEHAQVVQVVKVRAAAVETTASRIRTIVERRRNMEPPWE